MSSGLAGGLPWTQPSCPVPAGKGLGMFFWEHKSVQTFLPGVVGLSLKPAYPVTFDESLLISLAPGMLLMCLVCVCK